MLALLPSCSSPSSPLLHRSSHRSSTAARASFSYRPPVAAVSSAASSPASATSERSSTLYHSHYAVLGIPPEATMPEIKSAYRRLARRCHPDVSGAGARDGQRETPAGEFIRLHSAYATLSDPEKRAAYDLKMLSLRLRPILSFSSNRRPGVCGFSGRRNWEYDQCW